MEGRRSLLDRIRDAFDAPRFCPDDGEPIKVRSVPSFDPTTGAESADWYWSCPEVRVSVGGGRVRWSQSGDHLHVHGNGRPRWHRLAALSSDPTT